MKLAKTKQKPFVILDLDLDAESIKQLELIARDSAMTTDKLVTDIVKGFLYQSAHHDDSQEELSAVKNDLKALRLALADWILSEKEAN